MSKQWREEVGGGAEAAGGCNFHAPTAAATRLGWAKARAGAKVSGEGEGKGKGGRGSML